MGSGVKDDVLNSFCWMYSTFNLPPSYSGACARRAGAETPLYNTYYQVNYRPYIGPHSKATVSVGGPLLGSERRAILLAEAILADDGGRTHEILGQERRGKLAEEDENGGRKTGRAFLEEKHAVVIVYFTFFPRPILSFLRHPSPPPTQSRGSGAPRASWWKIPR